MKIKVCGVLFLLSVLVCGSGIDTGSMVQFWFGAVLGLIFGGVVAYETNKETIEKNVRINNSNVHSRACYLPK